MQQQLHAGIVMQIPRLSRIHRQKPLGDPHHLSHVIYKLRSESSNKTNIFWNFLNGHFAGEHI